VSIQTPAAKHCPAGVFHFVRRIRDNPPQLQKSDSKRAVIDVRGMASLSIEKFASLR
jgi:hypothetical protein